MTMNVALTARINLLLATLRTYSGPTEGFVRLNRDLSALLAERRDLRNGTWNDRNVCDIR